MRLISESDYIAHHGIKGQKWGIRRYRNADGTLTEAGKKHYLKQIDRAERRQKIATIVSLLLTKNAAKSIRNLIKML